MTRRRRHSEEFKQNAVRLMLGEGRTASDVARELRIHPSQLFRWKQELRDTAAPMPKQESVEQEPTRRPQDWTAEQKLEAVMASQKLPDAELGTFLRTLDEWRESVMRAARAELGGGVQAKSRESKRIRELGPISTPHNKLSPREEKTPTFAGESRKARRTSPLQTGGRSVGPTGRSRRARSARGWRGRSPLAGDCPMRGR